MRDRTVIDEAPKPYQGIPFIPPENIDSTFTMGILCYHGDRVGLDLDQRSNPNSAT